jgi:non-ribosomal peptide synthetase component F
VWQRRWLTGDTLDRLTRYWRERLAGHVPALTIPTDRPRPRTPAFRGAVEWISVPGALATPLIAIGREEGATAFMTLLAAFKVLLHTLSGQDDVLVGSPAAMRNRPELERLIGFFANTLVYRTDLSGGPGFRALVQRVRATALGVYAHQDLPFERVVEAVAPARDPSRNPLVQANLRVEGREPAVSLRGVRATPLVVDPGIARFDLAIELGATDDGFAGYLEYDSALFEPATAVRFAQDFQTVLAAVVSSPDRPLGALGPVRGIVRRRAQQGGRADRGH